ncbi:hypothetical protein HK104_000358 [Borealophlyctis nickersoniae]|nr:hypothetical protein HK104_000358 [Borealophlyctis nickersoniae]
MSSQIQPSAPGSERVRICISVIRASNLPKVDKLSLIDAYVKVELPSCPVQRTKTIDDCSAPVWNAKLFFEVDASALYSCTPVQFDLFDENVMKDRYVANVSVILNPQLFADPSNRQLPLNFAKDKYRGAEPSYLEVSFSANYTFDSVVRRLQHISGFQVNAMDKKLYVPFPTGWAPLVLGIEFEGNGVDVKVYQIAPATNIHLDMALTTAHKTKIRRRSCTTPTPIKSTSLSYYEEIKLDDVPASADFSQLVIWQFKKEVVETLSLDSVVREHGWKGAMSFTTASKALRGVQIEQAEEAIYMPLAQGNCFLVVDFDESDVDMKCLVLDTPANANTAYDLAIRGPYNKKTSDVYVPSKPVLGGKYRATRRTELDDVPYGTSFGTMEWSKYALSEAMQISVADLVKLRPV